jgi:hypothetical protein
LRCGSAQRGQVVEDVEASAKGREHEIVFAFLNHEIANLNRRESSAEAGPLLPAVPGEPETELGADVEHVRILRIVDQRVDGSFRRKIARDRSPAATEIGALEEIGFVIAGHVAVECGVHRARVVARRHHARDLRGVRHAGE